MPLLLFTGGAAVKAGVHEGDRIIKVFNCFPSQTLNEKVIGFFLFSVADFSVRLPLSGERLAGVLHVPSGGGKAHQM